MTGARYVNLAWLEAGGWVRGSVWAFSEPDLAARALTQARYAVPGFDPMSVRFPSDVNAAVKRVFVERRAHFAPFSEHSAGTVHPLLTTLASRMLRLEWTHSVPLLVAGDVAGALAFHWAERPHPRALSVAEAFSAQVALTVENARLTDALRARVEEIASSSDRISSAAEETRREIARTLDRVGSRILVATQRLLGCRALLATSPDYAATELGHVAAELDRLREDEVRAASHRLHPSLIEVGLVPALEVLADSFGEVDVRVTTLPGVTALDGIARNALPSGLRLAMYRAIEEALDEIAGGGHARGARVEISIERGALRAEVSYHQGRGQATVGGATLRAIRDRIERVEGTADLAADEREARLVIVVPLPEAARRPATGVAGSDLFQRICENALGVTGGRMVTLSWHDPAEGALVFGALAPLGALGPLLAAARRIAPGFELAKMRFRTDLNPLVRAVFTEGRAMLARTAEHAAGTIDPAVLRAGMEILGFRWTYSVPLLVDGRVSGAVALHFADRPGDAVLAVADVFASQAALTVANERLAATMRERATELSGSRARLAAAEERVRRDVAESLHGRVQSRLLVVSHRLLEARPAVATDPHGTGSELDALAAELDRIREVDLAHAIDQLHPAIVSVGLMIALRHLAAEMSPRLDVAVSADAAVEALDDPTHGRIPEPVRLEVYRTVEEALANVARHAGTATAAVRVELAADTLRTTVSDGGRGYDAAAAREGVGLRSMRDRAGQLGGTVAIDGAPGRGTTVTLALPLRSG